MALYTGKGDKGDTGYFNSKERVSKASARPEALGACDELNSLLGVCKERAKKEGHRVKNVGLYEIVHYIQENLFIVQSELAGASNTISESKVKNVESIIEKIDRELPEIKTFRISGGTELSAMFDHARAVSRRTERRVVAAKSEAPLSDHSYQFMNRLSSLLYAFARLINVRAGITEDTPNYE